MNSAVTAASPNGESRPKRAWPFHPLTFALFPLLALFTHNMGGVRLSQIEKPLIWTLLGTSAAWALFGLISRSAKKGALIASAAVLIFYSYGHVARMLPDSFKPAIGPSCLLVFAALLYFVIRSGSNLVDATRVLNFTSIVLLLPSAWNLVAILSVPWAPHYKVTGGLRSPADRPVSHRVKPGKPVSDDLADIYYIILDAYGRQDSLRKFQQFDNKPFIDELKKRGFYVADKSRANYDQTPLCLASSLNLDYLDGPALAAGPYGNSTEPARRLLDDNAVAGFLSKLGYHYVYVWSGTAETGVGTADLVLERDPQTSSFEGQLKGLTALDMNERSRAIEYDQHRRNLLAAFDHLDTVAQLPYPKFVFTHILAPHPPFVLGFDGSLVTPRVPFSYDDASWLLQHISQDDYRRGYTQQLQYVNNRTLQAIDNILKQSKRRPIIIIQGDHGSRMSLDWDSLEKTDLREPFSILNAYLVPDNFRRSLYSSISPVNSFRLLLSKEFKANYDRLPDRSFYSPASRPFDFTEVTNLIRPMEP